MDARRRLCTTMAAVVAVLAAALPPAGAAARNDARQRYQEVQKRLVSIAEQHTEAQRRLDEVTAKVAATTRAIKSSSAESRELRERLRERMRWAYRHGTTGYLDFLFSASSLREFSLRTITLERQVAQDEDVILKLRRTSAGLEAKQDALAAQRRERSDVLATLRKQRAEAEATFKDARRIFAEFDAEVRAQQAANLYATVRSHPRGFVPGRVVTMRRCPSAGPRAFSNDWGACRGGGCRRRHKGNDILSPSGTPSVAVVPGTIRRLSAGGNAGLAIYLWGDDGVEYRYFHMRRFAVREGEHVEAGQLVGTVGDTGNARGGPPHIHFEVHPGGGGAINPYPSLVRVC